MSSLFTMSESQGGMPVLCWTFDSPAFGWCGYGCVGGREGGTGRGEGWSWRFGLFEVLPPTILACLQYQAGKGVW